MTEQTAPTFVAMEYGTLVTVSNKTWTGYVAKLISQDEKKSLVEVVQGPTDKKNSQIGRQFSVKTASVQAGAVLRLPKPVEAPAA